MKSDVRLAFPTVPPALIDSVTGKVEGILWGKFDKMKEEGKFKKKILLGYNIDVSGIVAFFLTEAFGPRPVK